MAKKLSEIDGLGKKTERRLANHGIESIEDMAEIDPEEMAKEMDRISSNRLRGWRNEAQRSAVTIMTGDEVKQEYQSLEKISTGIEALDEILGGGWESGFLVAVAGESGSGKTQLSFQTLGKAVQEQDLPGVYIETERGRYRGNRIQEMFNEEVQQDVYKIAAYDLEQQEMAYEKIKQKFGPNDISCVVVDSFTARFRMDDNFTGRSDLPDRHTVMSRHLKKLDTLAARCEVPVILTCQVSANPGRYGGQYTIYGGTLMHHMVNFICMMKSKQGALTNIELRNHPEVENQELQLQINSGGVDVAGE